MDIDIDKKITSLPKNESYIQYCLIRQHFKFNMNKNVLKLFVIDEEFTYYGNKIIRSEIKYT